MKNNIEETTQKEAQNERNNILRRIFLNLLKSVFIIMCYFYISEFFGSISTIYVENSEFLIQFGFTLLIFTILAILAGAYHGFIAGFIGEFLYQLAYYDTIHLDWCFIIAIWGFMCGIYKYKPLKYQKRIKMLYTFLALIISSLITIFILIIFQNLFFPHKFDIEDIILNFGVKFIIQSFLTVILLVPPILFLYDWVFAKKENHLYFLLLTHHTISQRDHTFYFKFGRTYIYLCSRCSGIMIGGILASFSTHLIMQIYDIEFNPEIALILCVLLPLPGLIDWGTQRILLRKSTTESRLFTGFVLGSALHFLSFTNKYFFFMIFLVILYFSILGILMYIGIKKEMRLFKEELEKDHPSNNQNLY
ncbi:MAG: DUF2085 domain-containing protein [Promethearchaeota archaeon]